MPRKSTEDILADYILSLDLDNLKRLSDIISAMINEQEDSYQEVEVWEPKVKLEKVSRKKRAVDDDDEETTTTATKTLKRPGKKGDKPCRLETVQLSGQNKFIDMVKKAKPGDELKTNKDKNIDRKLWSHREPNERNRQSTKVLTDCDGCGHEFKIDREILEEMEDMEVLCNDCAAAKR